MSRTKGEFPVPTSGQEPVQMTQINEHMTEDGIDDSMQEPLIEEVPDDTEPMEGAQSLRGSCLDASNERVPHLLALCTRLQN